MTTVKTSIYTEPSTTLSKYIYPHPIQSTFDESDAPTESPTLYSARWRNLRKFGGTGDPTEGRSWSRNYNFVSLPIYPDAEKAKQVENHKKVLSNPSNAIISSRRQRYVDMIQGRSRFSNTYARQNEKGTNYNTQNLIHIDSDGTVLNDSDPNPLPVNVEIGPFKSVTPMVPLISNEMTNPFPQVVTPINNSRFMPQPIVSIPPSIEYGISEKRSVLLTTVASNPDVIESISQRYVFKLNGKQKLASAENIGVIMNSPKSGGEAFDERTLFIDENFEYYVLRKDNPQPTWDSDKWVRHYLTQEYATLYFDRSKTGPIIPGIDLTVTKWLENPEGVILIDFVGTMQFETRQYNYGNTEGTENFRVMYHDVS